jgi:hypothetical protein
MTAGIGLLVAFLRRSRAVLKHMRIYDLMPAAGTNRYGPSRTAPGRPRVRKPLALDKPQARDLLRPSTSSPLSRDHLCVVRGRIGASAQQTQHAKRKARAGRARSAGTPFIYPAALFCLSLPHRRH